MKTLCYGLLFLFISDLAYGQATEVLFDFESGHLDEWTIIGENPLVHGAPLHDTITSIWERGPIGYKGKFYLETGAKEGRHTVNPDGSLVSPTFEINRPYLNFYLGGELYPNVRVYLLIDDKIVREAFGNNFYDLQLSGWGVSEFLNRQARFVLEDRSDMRSLIRLDHVFLSDSPPPKHEDWPQAKDRQRSALLLPGEFNLIFSNKSIGENWKVTRSSVVYGPDKKWHLYVSAYQGANQWKMREWNRIFHATAENLTAPEWEFEGMALAADRSIGEEFLWDPFVIVHEGRNYMCYVSGGNTWSGWYPPPSGTPRTWHAGMSGDQGPYFMSLAVSNDGVTWDRIGNAIPARKGVIFADKPFAFAPFVMRHNDEWVMYYASATDESVEAKHPIGYRTSKDLINWSERKIALKDWEIGVEGAPDASNPASPWPEHSFITNPVVFQKDNRWFLLAGPIDNDNLSRYHVLRIFISKNPFKWNDFDEALRINKRIFVDGGAKPIRDVDGKWYITTTNDMSGGVWLAPLFGMDESK